MAESCEQFLELQRVNLDVRGTASFRIDYCGNEEPTVVSVSGKFYKERLRQACERLYKRIKCESMH
ncbi:MAG: hypothetical protein C0507_07625 [Cyanobacteria bacterium PR.3.49]|nr:hypothetical protein [Cyanobacteria bacterium PR.3.49]